MDVACVCINGCLRARTHAPESDSIAVSSSQSTLWVSPMYSIGVKRFRDVDMKAMSTAQICPSSSGTQNDDGSSPLRACGPVIHTHTQPNYTKTQNLIV
jgi:hypothetical protein